MAVCGDIAHAVLAVRRQRQGTSYIHLFVLAMCTLVAGGHAVRIAWLALDGASATSLLQASVWSVSLLTAFSLALPALAVGALLIAHRQIVTRAEHAGNHDFLTGAASRKGFFDVAAREMARACRTGHPLALLLVDMDHFKGINDRWGHQAGDAALQRLVDGAHAVLRTVDCVARLGGDEFALLLPATDLIGAAAAAARLQQVVRHADEQTTAQMKAEAGGETERETDRAVALTLSIGITLIVAGEDIAAPSSKAGRRWRWCAERRDGPAVLRSRPRYCSVDMSTRASPMPMRAPGGLASPLTRSK
jgi:diguanylate cyclase (GGDEF)-like protein